MVALDKCYFSSPMVASVTDFGRAALSVRARNVACAKRRGTRVEMYVFGLGSHWFAWCSRRSHYLPFWIYFPLDCPLFLCGAPECCLASHNSRGRTSRTSTPLPPISQFKADCTALRIRPIALKNTARRRPAFQIWPRRCPAAFTSGATVRQGERRSDNDFHDSLDRS